MKGSIRQALLRYSTLLLLDILAVFLSFNLALLLRFEWNVPSPYVFCFFDTIWVLIIAYCAVNAACGLYGPQLTPAFQSFHTSWSYASRALSLAICALCMSFWATTSWSSSAA